MPCIVSGALINPLFELKWLNYICQKLGTFSLFAHYSSDNLVHILFQLGTFHAHYTTQRNQKDFLLMLKVIQGFMCNVSECSQV